MRELLKLKGVSVRRGEADIIRDVDLDLAREELLLVLGPNGAGKSTLARVALGLEQPSNGTVVRTPGISVGYVPQALRRDPTLPLSTGGFLALSPARHVQSTSVIGALGLGALLSRPLASLSGGELRRAALARALIRQPDLIVLDEPLAGIDAATQEVICELITQHRNSTGAGVLLIAHEVSTAAIATRILCLDGTTQASGTPADVIASDAFKRLFGTAMAAAALTQILPSRPSSGRAAHG